MMLTRSAPTPQEDEQAIVADLEHRVSESENLFCVVHVVHGFYYNTTPKALPTRKYREAMRNPSLVIAVSPWSSAALL